MTVPPKKVLGRTKEGFLHKLLSDEGSVAISFILTLPIFLFLVGVIVQFSLLANARLVVERAAEVAARAAKTSLPDHHPDNIRSAALMALEEISPKATSGDDPTATDVADALSSNGVNVAGDYASRYTYAMAATVVSWDPQDDFNLEAGKDVAVTVTYRFYLTVPAAMVIIAPNTDTVAGIEGRFYTVTSTVHIQTSHGRAAQTQVDGSAQTPE